MIISRTPFRISFFGGGTDYPAWVEKHGGAVLSTSFDKYNYITCRVLPPFFDHKHRISYSIVEHVRGADEIRHPAIRAAVAGYMGDIGLELHCDADLPARSGLGSSSSFMVGLLHALEALKGRQASREWLAREAIRYEQEILRENVGCQDQVAAAFGGLNIIHFNPGGEFKVEPLILPRERKKDFCRRLMLFFTGFSRTASEVAKSQVDNIDRNAAELQRIRAMVDEAAAILASGRDINLLGELLHQGWQSKRALSDKISTGEIDAIYEKARAAGAIGGKLLGAGGGGFIIFFVEPEKQAAVRQALKGLIHVPFRFESEGSRIIWYND
ncbi:MAG: kinase [Planctomycetota bacterium]|jgi:D-glycero-alpha-D-manno-heptose-7-phosphate kinase|nr:kinase [Planctomycetota bacterium]